MSASKETQTPQQPVKKSGKRKRLLLLLTLLFIIIAVAIGIYWFWYCVISKKPMTHTWRGIDSNYVSGVPAA